VIQGDVEEGVYPVPYNASKRVSEGDDVLAGQALMEVSVDLKEHLRIQGIDGVQQYLLREVQKVYRMQGVEIGDKHVEVMVRQMIRKIRVVESGDTDELPGSLLEIHQFRDANQTVLQEGRQPAIG